MLAIGNPTLFSHFIHSLRCAFCRCYLCRLPIDNQHAICTRCQRYFEQINQACRRCAMPMQTSSDTLCGQCQPSQGYIDNAHIFWRYTPPLTGLIHDFKYHNQLFLAPFLAHCMQRHLPQPLTDIDYLIPMPIHRKRLRSRGFNQTSLLAKALSKQTGIPMNQTLCQRIVFHSPQALLNQTSRQSNIKNAFRSKPADQLNLVIIDDIMTTGATANALAKELKRQGASRVDLWCIARQY